MTKTKIYLAGPLFTWYDRNFNKKLANFLEANGYRTFLPQKSENNVNNLYGKFFPKAIFKNDLEGIKWANLILANLDGSDVDSGTAWECGYAKALGKKVYGYRFDFRSIHERVRINLMIAEGVDMYHEFPMEHLSLPFTEIANKILRFIRTPIIKEE